MKSEDTMSLNCRKFVFYSLVSATLFSLCSISSGWAAAPELKPVLKPIDPSMAKLDAPPPDPESESNSVPDPAEDPGAKFNRTQQSSSSIPQAPSAPALGSYGMPGGGDPAPYRPSTDPNDRRNQVFTPPWQQKQYSPVSTEKQVALIYAGTKGYLDDIAKDRLNEFEEKFYDFLDASCSDLLSSIKASGELDEKTEKNLKTKINDFIKGF